MSVPKLRFKDEKGSEFPLWEEANLLSLDKNENFTNGVFNDPAKVGRGYKLINVLNMYTDGTIDDNSLNLVDIDKSEFFKNKVFHGDVFFTRSSLVKEGIAHSNVYLGFSDDVTFDGHLIKLSPNTKKVSPVFLNFLLKKSYVRKQLVSRGKTATMTTIGQKDIASVVVRVPALSEQTKIANFLTTIDDYINQLTRKHALLTQYKKATMQQIFSQQLRFKDEKGEDFADWEDVELKDITDRVVRKNKENNQNILTISAQFGLINQKEFFSKSVSSKNVTGYYLLHKDDFAYNKSYSNGYPMGAIKRLNRYEKGAVSTLYICFRFKENVNFSFFEYYFDAGLQNQELEMVAQEGARNHGLLNIGLSEFFGIRLFIPSYVEQTKIANFLTQLDQQLAQLQQQIDQIKQYKQGLLQQMFV